MSRHRDCLFYWFICIVHIRMSHWVYEKVVDYCIDVSYCLYNYIWNYITLTRQTCWTRVTKQPKTADESDFGKKNYSAPKFAPKSPEQSIIQFLVCCTHNTASYDKASSINCGFFISSSSEFSTVKTLHMIYLHLRLYFVFYSTKDI